MYLSGQKFNFHPSLFFFWLVDGAALCLPIIGIPTGEQGLCAGGFLAVLLSLARHGAMGNLETQLNGLLKFWGYFVILVLLVQTFTKDPLVPVAKSAQAEAFQKIDWMTERLEATLTKRFFDQCGAASIEKVPSS